MSTLRLQLLGPAFGPSSNFRPGANCRTTKCVAISNPTRSKAEALGKRMEIAGVYSDPAELLEKEQVDFVDIIISVQSHHKLAALAISKGLPVICQKPMSETLEQAEDLVRMAKRANVPLFVHENFRWQEPVRAAARLARLLKAGVIGDAFRARVDFISGFPVFDNQPALNTMDPFILMDLGTHVLDVARFLFGEASRVYCQTQRIHTDALGTTDVMYVCGGGIFAPSLRRSWEAPACSADAAKSFLALFWEQSSFRPLRPGWSSSTSTLTCIR